MLAKYCAVLLFYCCVTVNSVEQEFQNSIHQLQCDCGRANERASKIIGGSEVTPHKYPWMVPIRVRVTVHYEPGLMCGGSLITRQYVLTAAHCMVNKRNVSVGVAVHDRNKPGEMIPAAAVKIHPTYRDERFADIALIKLHRPVSISERVGTLCLPHNLQIMEQPGRQVIAAGWGQTHPIEDEGSQFLKELVARLVDASWFITAQGVNRTSTCYGDSGSPLFTRYKDGRFHVIGVTSHGPEGCKGISSYTRVSLFNQWIMRNIMDSAPCALANDEIEPVQNNDL